MDTRRSSVARTGCDLRIGESHAVAAAQLGKNEGQPIKANDAVARGENRMSETDQPITQKQNSLIWQGAQAIWKLPEWTRVAPNVGHVGAVLFPPAGQILKPR